MEETKTQNQKTHSNEPVIHRICEACNNMFPTHAGNPDRRCPKCKKD